MILYWKMFLAVFAAGLLVASGAAYKVNGWHTASLKVAWAKATADAVTAAKVSTQAVCDANNQLTKDSAHALQTKLDATTARYYKLLKYQAGSSIGTPAATSATTGRDGQTGAAMPDVSLHLTDWADIAKRNDDQASALITLQDIVAGIYKANGQQNLLPDSYLTKNRP